MTREEALEELKLPLYNPVELEEDRLYFTKKLGISLDEYYKIMKTSPSNFNDFKNQKSIRESLNFLAKHLKKFIKHQNVLLYGNTI